MRQLLKVFGPTLIVVLLLGALHSLVSADSNEVEGRSPKVRPDGVSCQQVSGGIADYEEVINVAGVTYYGGWPVTATLSISAPFRLAFWDADGSPKTVATLYDRGAVVGVYDFKTDDNKWSDWVTITQQVDTISVQTPDDHKSTSLCFYRDSSTSATPPAVVVTPPSVVITATPPAVQTPPTVVITATPPAVQTPPATVVVTPSIPITDTSDIEIVGDFIPGGVTAIDGEGEPVKPSSNVVPHIPTGQEINYRVKIKNTGKMVARNVQLMMALTLASSDLSAPALIRVGDIAPGKVIELRYASVSSNGRNEFVAEIMGNETPDQDSVPGNSNHEEDDLIIIAFNGDSLLFLPVIRQ
jgi:hypothetical protein